MHQQEKYRKLCEEQKAEYKEKRKAYQVAQREAAQARKALENEAFGKSAKRPRKKTKDEDMKQDEEESQWSAATPGS
jgi:hypothetical protein